MQKSAKNPKIQSSMGPEPMKITHEGKKTHTYVRTTQRETGSLAPYRDNLFTRTTLALGRIVPLTFPMTVFYSNMTNTFQCPLSSKITGLSQVRIEMGTDPADFSFHPLHGNVMLARCCHRIKINEKYYNQKWTVLKVNKHFPVLTLDNQGNKGLIIIFISETIQTFIMVIWIFKHL